MYVRRHSLTLSLDGLHGPPNISSFDPICRHPGPKKLVRLLMESPLFVEVFENMRDDDLIPSENEPFFKRMLYAVFDAGISPTAILVL
jgi:hypothetical protein